MKKRPFLAPKDAGIHGNNAARNSRHRAQPRSARRRLIQALALGGGITSAKLIPGRWSSPVVKSALLPAHATSSICSLGNSQPYIINITENPNPDQDGISAPPGARSVAMRLADLLMPEASAGIPEDRFLVRLTGCFWIEFPCNSDRGTLFASAIDVTADFDEDEEEEQAISAPFMFGEQGDLEGYCFLVERGADGTYAMLRINFDCALLYRREPLMLRSPFDCRPIGPV